MKNMKYLVFLLLVLSLFSCHKKPPTDLIQLDAPIFSHPSGSYYTGQAIYLTCAEYGASIYYTTDGSDPTDKSELYSASNPLIVPTFFPEGENSVVVKAKAYKAGFDPSEISTATYTVTYFNTVPLCTFIPRDGDITTQTNVKIFNSVQNVEIYYTLDGSDPTKDSTLYTEEFHISQLGEVTLKSRAYRSGWNTSDVAQTSYTVSEP